MFGGNMTHAAQLIYECVSGAFIFQGRAAFQGGRGKQRTRLFHLRDNESDNYREDGEQEGMVGQLNSQLSASVDLVSVCSLPLQRTHTHTHTHTHTTHTHTHTHTHSHTHTHTHTQILTHKHTQSLTHTHT